MTLVSLKKILGLALALTSITTHAASFKLACNMRATYSYSTGAVENYAGKAIVEIEENPRGTIILIASEIEPVNELSITTLAREGLSVDNFSDDSKWEIINYSSRSTGKARTKLTIDRLTGLIVVSKYFSGNLGTTQTQASGDCESLNIKSKKF